ncbi:MAG: NHL repeat-containing protein [Planctomycetota bacterium]
MKRKAIGLFLGLAMVACGGGGGGGSGGSVYTLIAFDHVGDLYRINPATGNDTLLLDTFYHPVNPPVSLDRVSSAVYNDAAGAVWIGGGGNNVCASCTFEIDGATGEAIRLSDNAGVNLKATPGMAINSAGRIFVHQGEGTGLYSVDNVTGAATLISDTTAGKVGNGMVFDGSDVLYLATDSKLYTVDTITGDATEVANLTLIGFPPNTTGEIVSMTRRPTDDAIFCILKEGAGRGGGNSFFCRMNLANGEVTHIAELFRIMDGLAYVPTAALN